MRKCNGNLRIFLHGDDEVKQKFNSRFPCLSHHGTIASPLSSWKHTGIKYLDQLKHLYHVSPFSIDVINTIKITFRVGRFYLGL